MELRPMNHCLALKRRNLEIALSWNTMELPEYAELRAFCHQRRVLFWERGY